MPLYDYACSSCAHQFETIQKASDDPLRECPSCGALTLKKLLSALRFRLKGSGWYETDFKSGKKRNIAGSDNASKGASSGDSSSSSSDASSGGSSDTSSGSSNSSASTGTNAD